MGDEFPLSQVIEQFCVHVFQRIILAKGKRQRQNKTVRI
jgi:hypothetical protein